MSGRNVPAFPIAVGSSDEADNCPLDNDTEPSEEDPQVVTITSRSEGDEGLGGAFNEAPESRADAETARGTRSDVPPEGDEAEETESGTTDEVIDVEVCEEKTTAQTATPAAEAGVRHIPGSSPALKEPHSPGSQTTAIPLPVCLVEYHQAQFAPASPGANFAKPPH